MDQQTFWFDRLMQTLIVPAYAVFILGVIGALSLGATCATESAPAYCTYFVKKR
jgi:hypothetical protein